MKHKRKQNSIHLPSSKPGTSHFSPPKIYPRGAGQVAFQQANGFVFNKDSSMYRKTGNFSNKFQLMQNISHQKSTKLDPHLKDCLTVTQTHFKQSYNSFDSGLQAPQNVKIVFTNLKLPLENQHLPLISPTSSHPTEKIDKAPQPQYQPIQQRNVLNLNNSEQQEGVKEENVEDTNHSTENNESNIIYQGKFKYSNDYLNQIKLDQIGEGSGEAEQTGTRTATANQQNSHRQQVTKKNEIYYSTLKHRKCSDFQTIRQLIQQKIDFSNNKRQGRPQIHIDIPQQRKESFTLKKISLEPSLEKMEELKPEFEGSQHQNFNRTFDSSIDVYSIINKMKNKKRELLVQQRTNDFNAMTSRKQTRLKLFKRINERNISVHESNDYSFKDNSMINTPNKNGSADPSFQVTQPMIRLKDHNFYRQYMQKKMLNQQSQMTGLKSSTTKITTINSPKRDLEKDKDDGEKSNAQLFLEELVKTQEEIKKSRRKILSKIDNHEQLKNYQVIKIDKKLSNGSLISSKEFRRSGDSSPLSPPIVLQKKEFQITRFQ